MQDSNGNIQVIYIIPSLGAGDLSGMLLQLLGSELGKQYSGAVVALQGSRGLRPALEALNIPVLELDVKRFWQLPARLWQLYRLFADNPVQLVYSFTHRANLFAVLLRYVASLVDQPFQLIWGLYDRSGKEIHAPWNCRLILWLTRHLSQTPRQMVVTSARSRQRYIESGYSAKSMTLIPGGIRIDPAFNKARILHDRNAVRSELGLDNRSILIGSMSRYSREKDIATLFEAFALMPKSLDVHLLLLGEGLDNSNVELVEMVEIFGIEHRVRLLGVRDDTNRLIRSFDIATLSSRTEAFPLFIAEAMSQGVPCVATDVGDVALLLGEYGEVVPAEQPVKLLNAWNHVLELSGAERWGLISGARQRVASQFDLKRVARHHRQLYESLLNESGTDTVRDYG